MKALALLGILAMIPAAIRPAQAANPAAKEIPMVSCAGNTRVLLLPVGSDGPSPAEQQPCCNKGCHGSTCRKRLSGGI